MCAQARGAGSPDVRTSQTLQGTHRGQLPNPLSQVSGSLSAAHCPLQAKAGAGGKFRPCSQTGTCRPACPPAGLRVATGGGYLMGVTWLL